MTASIGTNSRLSKISVAEVIYYIAFSLHFFTYVLENTTFEEFLFVPVASLTKAIQVTVILLLVMKFLSQRASFAGWALAAIVVMVGFISWRQSGEGYLFWLALFVVCSDGIKLKPLATIVFVLTSVMFTLTVVFAYMGIIEDVLLRRGLAYRHSLGFSHPNNVGLFLLILCTSFSIIRFGKNPLPDIILILLAAAFNLALADSRTAAVMSLVQIIFLLIFNYVRDAKKRYVVLVGICAFVGLTVAVSYYFMVNYDSSNSLHAMLNSAFSDRLYLQHGYYQMQDLTLFGSTFEGHSPIYWTASGEPATFLVDNAWCHLLLRYGIIPTFLFLLSLIALLRILVRETRWDAVTFGLLLTLTYGISETTGICFEPNYFLFIIGTELLFVFSNSKDSRLVRHHNSK